MLDGRLLDFIDKIDVVIEVQILQWVKSIVRIGEDGPDYFMCADFMDDVGFLCIGDLNF